MSKTGLISPEKGAAGQVPVADGAGGFTWVTPSSAGPLTKAAILATGLDAADLGADAAGAAAAEAVRAETAEALLESVAALNAEVARAETAEGLLIPLSQRAAANGVGTLDGSGRQPIGQAPLSVGSASALPSGTRQYGGRVAVPASSASNVFSWQGKPVLDGQDYLATANLDNTAALAAMLTDAAASGDPTILQLQAGDLQFEGSVTNWPLGLPVCLRGHGKGAAGGIIGTRLRRTSGTSPLLQALGSGDTTADRVIVDLRDIEFYGSDLGGVLVDIEHAEHNQLNSVRIAHNEGGCGLLAVNWDDSIFPGPLVVEYCGGVGSFTATTNATTLLSGVSGVTWANIIPQVTVISGVGAANGATVVAVNQGAGTITLDRAMSNSTTETLTYVNPAHVFTSTIGDGGGGCASVYCGVAKYQSNYGTDLRLTGSVPDSSPSNDIAYGLLSMEGNGAGTSGSPDAYPYIDLDYAQDCGFPKTRISMPTGRNGPFVQQIGVSAGPRANDFGLLTMDVAGSSAPARLVDMAAGTLWLGRVNAPGTVWTSEWLRIQSSVAAGRCKFASINHNSSTPYSGFITDARTVNEFLSKGRVVLGRPISQSAGVNAAAAVGVAYTFDFLYGSPTDSNLAWQTVMPHDADPNGRYYLNLYWTSDVGNATLNVEWYWFSGPLVAGSDATAVPTNYILTAALPATAGLVNVSTIGSGSTAPICTPGALITCELMRKATNVADTATTAKARLLGAEIFYDRRQ